MPPRNRSDALADALRTGIRQGDWPPDAKLPSERALGTDHRVSRTVVREAVARLKSEGLVVTRKGAATRIADPAGAGAPGLAMPQSINGLLGFLEVRRAVEADMAALAAERRTDADCDALGVAIRAIDLARDAGRTGVEEDLLFHLAIGRATGNTYWNQFVRLFAEPMRLAIGITRANEARRADFAASVAAEHRAILGAIRRRDPNGARAAVGRHIANAASRVMRADEGFWASEGRDLARAWERALRDHDPADEPQA